MDRRNINASDAPPPVGLTYSQAVEVVNASRTLYISGQVGIDASGTIPEDIVEQSKVVWANIEAQLRAGGMSLDNVVKITTIVTDHSYIAASRTARLEVLGDRRPGSTLIVAGLVDPAMKIEIEAIAVA